MLVFNSYDNGPDGVAWMIDYFGTALNTLKTIQMVGGKKRSRTLEK